MPRINFLQKLIRSLAPSVFKPVPTGILYVMLQSISREISGICPWDTGESCYKNYTTFWSLNCRNIRCKGYRHPVGVIAYTSRSSDYSISSGPWKGPWITAIPYIPNDRVENHGINYLCIVSHTSGSFDDEPGVGAVWRTYWTLATSRGSSIDNRFDYSSFRYNSVAPDQYNSGSPPLDWIPVGTLGTKVWFDWGSEISDPGGFGWYFFGERYWGDNSYYKPEGFEIHIGDKWYIDCHVANTVIGTNGKNYQCKVKHTSSNSTKPITGADWDHYWKEGGLNGDQWQDVTVYDILSIVDSPIPDPSNEGSYAAVSSGGIYTGAHDTTYTIELIDFWGYVQNYDNALTQINLSTCTDVWLDFWGEYFGLDRLFLINGYEEDSAYRERILKEITRAKGTKAVLLEEAKAYFRSDLVTITEYENTPIAPDNHRWDGPVTDIANPAYGLWPFQFYINLPTQRTPSAKFVKTASTLVTPSDGSYIGTSNIAVSGEEWTTSKAGGSTGYLHQPVVPLISVIYDSPRTKNFIYIYREANFSKPIWETGLQEIIDRLKCAGTVAIMNPIPGEV